MKNIGLFFGSFNPIHNGHVLLADFMFNYSGVDEIWFVISPKNPLKEQSELLAEEIRCKLVELATEEIPYMYASTVEFDLPKPSYTVSTLRVLKEKYPEDEFILIIGSDNMAIFNQWKDYKEIMEEYPILVYPREGFPVEEYEDSYPEMQVIDDAPLFEISSTKIREMIKKGEDASRWLNPYVYRYILDYGLYK